MRYITAVLALLVLAAAAPANIAGTWQGTIDHNRRVMVISKTGNAYHVVIHSIDETDVPIVTNNVTVDGSHVTMKFDMNVDPWIGYHRMYSATLATDGTTLKGIWSDPQGPKVPMTYDRVARATWHGIDAKTTMVQVAPNVHDEVLDFGGTGRDVLLLAGLGGTAHAAFTAIIPTLTKHYHVYAMTRRGFGNSTQPPWTAQNYSADQLGDDVVAVIDGMHLDKAVLIGHSIAGEELSDVGTRYPQKVSALVYLDAGYGYAIAGPDDPRKRLKPDSPPPMRAYIDGMKPFHGPIDLPILAIFAYPGDPSEVPKADRTPAKIKSANAAQLAQIEAFSKALPRAKVIEIPHASHFVFLSNTAEVLKDVLTFIGSLKS